MITLTNEEAQQVLDIMESTHFAVADNVKHSVVMEHVTVIEQLRARLAQPEPPCKTGSQCIGGKCTHCAQPEPSVEPVAKNEGGRITWLVDRWPKDCLLYTTLPVSKSDESKWIDEPQKVGTAPPQREEKLLTQEQAIDVAQKLFDAATLCSLPPSATTWQNAALRLGEELSTVGPDGYYKMDAHEWLDWALKTVQPARIWQSLTDEEIRRAKHHMVEGAYDYSFKQGAQWAERVLKEKNT